MNQKYFTRDRIFNLLSSIVGTAAVFILPKITTVFVVVTWVGISIYGAFTLFGEYILLEGSGRTGVYAAVIAIRQNKKKHGPIGQALDHVPPAVFAGAWIWNAHLFIGATIGFLWIISVLQVSRYLYVWRQLDEKVKKTFLKAVQKD